MREDGKVVAMILRSWQAEEQTRFEGAKAENKAKLQREFASWMGSFRQRGAIVDSPMDWLARGGRLLPWGEIFGDRHFPRRYAWDDAARRWVKKAGFAELEWRIRGGPGDDVDDPDHEEAQRSRRPPF